MSSDDRQFIAIPGKRGRHVRIAVDEGAHKRVQAGMEMIRWTYTTKEWRRHRSLFMAARFKYATGAATLGVAALAGSGLALVGGLPGLYLGMAAAADGWLT